MIIDCRSAGRGRGMDFRAAGVRVIAVAGWPCDAKDIEAEKPDAVIPGLAKMLAFFYMD